MACSCPVLNPFHWNDPLFAQQIDWSKLTETQLSSARSTEIVEAKRREGVDLSTLAYLARVASGKKD